jgi:hypothetical protein
MNFVGSFNPNPDAIAADFHDLNLNLPIDVDCLTDLSAKHKHDLILPEPELIEGRIFVPYPEAGLYSCYGTPNESFHVHVSMGRFCTAGVDVAWFVLNVLTANQLDVLSQR